MIAQVPDLMIVIVSFPTRLIFRYYLPLRSPGIDSKESTLPAYVSYVAWRAGTTNRLVVRAESVPGLLKGLQIWALVSRYSTAHLKVRCQPSPPPPLEIVIV
jgi:hypothetical protein